MRELEEQRNGRNKNTIIDYKYINSNRFRKRFDHISNNKKLNKLLYKTAKKMLLHRSGTEYEDMCGKAEYIIDNPEKLIDII